MVDIILSIGLACIIVGIVLHFIALKYDGIILDKIFDEPVQGPVHDDLVYRLRKRAEIRRQIQSRKSVQEGKPDRIADLLEEAADRIEGK